MHDGDQTGDWSHFSQHVSHLRDAVDSEEALQRSSDSSAEQSNRRNDEMSGLVFPKLQTFVTRSI